jgi:hypothetical protein
MKQFPTFKLLLLSASCSLILSACGGSGTTTATNVSPTTDPSTTAPVTAVSTPVSVVGRITAFGSIYVNGVRYDINNANLNNDGPDGTKALNESDLKIGMVVNLTGTRTGTTGSATSVSYNELIEAPVTSVSINNSGIGSLIAGGKQINISNTTMFYGGTSRSSINNIVAGDWIEVSGYVGSDGSIDATMVSYETEVDHANRAEIEGIVSNLDATTQQFTLNGINVDYSAAILSSTTTALTNGLPVEVYGTLNTTTNSLIATHIEIEHSSSHLDSSYSGHSDHDNDGNYEYELQGIVSGATAGQFTLAGVTVLYDTSTRFSGLSSAQIQDGLFLEEVEGRYNAQGQFVASEIEVENHSINGVSDDNYSMNELEVSSTVSAIDTVNNTLTVMGYTVAITASTLLKDDDRGEYYFNINSLSVGDYVEADLIKNTDNSYSLRKLERERMEYGSSIEGSVSQVNVDGSVVIGATTIVLPTGRTAAVGQRIEVDGTYDPSSQTLMGTRFEYED